MAFWHRAALLPSLLLFTACGDKDGGATESDGSTGTPGSTSEEAPTTGASTSTTGNQAARPNWHEDIAPLVAANCQSCHYDGGVAPFSMMTYEEASPWAPVMAFDTAEGLMPPWHALETDVCQPPFAYRHDARLTEDEKALFQAWSDNGAPEGDPALAAPIPPAPSLDLPNPTTSALMQSPLTIDAVGKTLDFFHCISIDPGNAETVYLDGAQVIAGNRKIVHHVLIYTDVDAESASWPGGVKPNCGGGAGIGGGQLIGGWVPGGMPMEAPDNVGTELPPGTRLVLSVHYHATGAGPETDDATGLALRWTTTKPQWVSYFTLIGAPGIGQSLTGPLMIPAGASDHVEEYEFDVSLGGQTFPDLVDVRVWSVLNHMHKIGVDMRLWVEDRDTGAATCLLHTPRWDFDWQRSYTYEAPITESFRVKAGDKVRIRCVYNNTLDNPGVQEVLAEAGLDAPVDIGLGEGTLDEMCLTGIGVAVKGI